MKGAIIITWGTPARGREQEAVDVLRRVLEFHENLVKQGQVERHTALLASTKMGGTIVLEGDTETLSRIQSDAECQQYQLEAASTVDDFAVNFAIGGTSAEVRNHLEFYTGTMTRLFARK